MRHLVTLALVAALFAGCAGTEDATNIIKDVDTDGDHLPDATEAAVCGYKDVRDAVNKLAVAGACHSAKDYELPISVAATVFVPAGIVAGEDKDKDGFPATFQLKGLALTVDTTAGNSLLSVEESTFPLVVALDFDDHDPNMPVLSTLASPIAMPLGAASGPDKDRDAFPEHVDVIMMEWSFDRRDAQPLTMTAVSTLAVKVDLDDSNDKVPAPSVVTLSTVPVPYSVTIAPDGDMDGFPSGIEVLRQIVTVDRRLDMSAAFVAFTPAASLKQDIDTDDGDDNEPVVSKLTASVPVWAEVYDDGDGDLLPSGVQLTHLAVTVDRHTEVARPIDFELKKGKFLQIDPDDEDPKHPIPVDAKDHDGDAIPDVLEPVICKANNEATDADGRCVRADGSGHDGSGENYIPPLSISNLAATLVDTGSIGESVSAASAADVKDAPGLFVLPALLAGLYLRRRQ